MAEERRCSHCDRVIEICSFCDEEACAEALCYRCVLVDVTGALLHPHLHGG